MNRGQRRTSTPGSTVWTGSGSCTTVVSPKSDLLSPQVEVRTHQSIVKCAHFRKFLLPACTVELYLQHDFCYTTEKMFRSWGEHFHLGKSRFSITPTCVYNVRTLSGQNDKRVVSVSRQFKTRVQWSLLLSWVTLFRVWYAGRMLVYNPFVFVTFFGQSLLPLWCKKVLLQYWVFTLF